MKKYFLEHSSTLPATLMEEASERWQRFVQSAQDAGACPAAAISEISEDEALRLFAFSEFAASSCISSPEIICTRQKALRLHASYPAEIWPILLEETGPEPHDDNTLATLLRRFRRREMVRIAWRDIAGLADLSETVSDLSNLAEIALRYACSRIHSWLSEEYGEPVGSSDASQQLVTVAMGKLGARELNFSSDIDLIFTFPEHGTTSGGSRGSISCEQFFTRLCRRLISVIGAARADGFVFRVDTRLRPWGDSGPICMSFDAIEEYYEAQGREWERYAWIKARPVTGLPEHGKELMKRLQPFVYRRYLDYSAFEALREMKGMIEAETRRRGMENNVKLGPGGIREVEFIAQAFQLLKGGRDVELRTPALMEVLPLLERRGILEEGLCERLSDAYVFLRNTEHRLQEQKDRQTQMLPEAEEMRLSVALSMGFAGIEPFMDALNSHRELVHQTFRSLFLEKEESSGNSKAQAVWQMVKARAAAGDDGSHDREFLDLLEKAGFPEPERAASLLYALCSNRSVQAMHERGRRRLDQLMPKVITAASETADPVHALGIMADIIAVIARRTVYLSLLDENPSAIRHMLKLCMASPWIASFIRKRPVVIDELLDHRTLYSPPGREELESLLEMRLKSLDSHDLEAQMDELRMFRQSAMMRIAAADITGAIPIMRVSDFLTETAEVITSKVLELSCTQIIEKFASPDDAQPACSEGGSFLIVAYGKFGGIELGYSSDLDMVFLHGDGHDLPVNSSQTSLFFARVGQRIIHILSTRTAAGILYETDLRLRPGGNAGPLVCSVPRMESYLKSEAWTWELQALIRARAVAGDPELAAGFEKVRKDVLCKERDPEALKREVSAMRMKMYQAHASGAEDGRFNLKHHRGGIVDIEFMVQYLVLANAARFPELCRWTDNVRLLDTLEACGIISVKQAAVMREAYLVFRSEVHRLSLQEKPPEVSEEKFKQEAEAVRALWDTIMA